MNKSIYWSDGSIKNFSRQMLKPFEQCAYFSYLVDNCAKTLKERLKQFRSGITRDLKNACLSTVVANNISSWDDLQSKYCNDASQKTERKKDLNKLIREILLKIKGTSTSKIVSNPTEDAFENLFHLTGAALLSEMVKSWGSVHDICDDLRIPAVELTEMVVLPNDLLPRNYLTITEIEDYLKGPSPPKSIPTTPVLPQAQPSVANGEDGSHLKDDVSHLFDRMEESERKLRQVTEQYQDLKEEYAASTENHAEQIKVLQADLRAVLQKLESLAKQRSEPNTSITEIDLTVSPLNVTVSHNQLPPQEEKTSESSSDNEDTEIQNTRAVDSNAQEDSASYKYTIYFLIFLLCFC